MVITQNDVGNDVKLITDSLADKNRPLVAPVAALKIAMLWPGLCLMGYLSALLWVLMTYTPVFNSFGDPVSLGSDYGMGLAASALTIAFALAIGAGMYGPALLYLTIPEKIREQSLVISNMKKLVQKVGLFFILCNFMLAVAVCFYRDLIVASPLLLLFSFIIMQGIISAEMTRYGIAPIMKKMVSLARKI